MDTIDRLLIRARSAHLHGLAAQQGTIHIEHDGVAVEVSTRVIQARDVFVDRQQLVALITELAAALGQDVTAERRVEPGVSYITYSPIRRGRMHAHATRAEAQAAIDTPLKADPEGW